MPNLEVWQPLDFTRFGVLFPTSGYMCVCVHTQTHSKINTSWFMGFNMGGMPARSRFTGHLTLWSLFGGRWNPFIDVEIPVLFSKGQWPWSLTVDETNSVIIPGSCSPTRRLHSRGDFESPHRAPAPREQDWSPGGREHLMSQEMGTHCDKLLCYAHCVSWLKPAVWAAETSLWISLWPHSSNYSPLILARIRTSVWGQNYLHDPNCQEESVSIPPAGFTTWACMDPGA